MPLIVEEEPFDPPPSASPSESAMPLIVEEEPFDPPPSAEPPPAFTAPRLFAADRICPKCHCPTRYRGHAILCRYCVPLAITLTDRRPDAE